MGVDGRGWERMGEGWECSRAFLTQRVAVKRERGEGRALSKQRQAPNTVHRHNEVICHGITTQ